MSGSAHEGTVQRCFHAVVHTVQNVLYGGEAQGDRACLQHSIPGFDYGIKPPGHDKEEKKLGQLFCHPGYEELIDKIIEGHVPRKQRRNHIRNPVLQPQGKGCGQHTGKQETVQPLFPPFDAPALCRAFE